MRINIFENAPTLQRIYLYNHPNISNTYVKFQGIYLAGSLSFNNVAMLFSASGTTAKTMTISFGLYSLNGATLSLANSASFSTAPTTNEFNWITLGTSATQDITPGNWYFGIIQSTSSNSRMSLGYMNTNFKGTSNTAQGGGLFFGIFGSNALPSSVATTAITLPTGANNDELSRHPYILISS